VRRSLLSHRTTYGRRLSARTTPVFTKTRRPSELLRKPSLTVLAERWSGATDLHRLAEGNIVDIGIFNIPYALCTRISAGLQERSSTGICSSNELALACQNDQDRRIRDAPGE
jgi:hypothetical protein